MKFRKRVNRPRMQDEIPTSLTAIRNYCVSDCCRGQAVEVRLCPSTTCPLYLYRSGHRNKAASVTPTRAIRLRCLDCLVFNRAEVRRCPAPDCWLYPLRFGRGGGKRGPSGGSDDSDSNLVE